MKRHLTCIVLMMAMMVTLAANASGTIKVKGIVVDENNEPLIGATVIEKGTRNGTQTDIEGNFTLDNVADNSKLVFTYVGMKKLEMAAKPEMTAVMETLSEMLDGIIVTAFGTAKKSAFTGSAAVIDSDRIEQKQVTNVMESLIGEVPGLNITPTTAPGSTSSILIRGAGSINAATDPLIVIDGMPYEGSWNGINPNDVANITVLKDAASSALYGARGANGVILITTKKGSTGKATVTLDAKWGANSRGIESYDRITDPGQYYETHYRALYNTYVANGDPAAVAHAKANQNLTAETKVGGLGYNVYSVPNGQYLIGTNGSLNPNAVLGNRVYVDGQYYTLYPDNWENETYRTGFRQEYNLSITGGNDRANVYGSFGYLSNEGIVAGSDYERFSAKLRASYEVKSWLNFGANFGYSHDKSKYTYSQNTDGDTYYATGNVFSDAMNMGAIYPMYVRDAQGNILYDSNGKVYDWGNGMYNTDNMSRPNCINTNTLNSLTADYYESTGNNMLADGYLDFTLPLGFKINIKAGTNVYERRVSSAVNPWYGWSAQTDGSLFLAHYRTTTFNFQQLLQWTKNSGDHHWDAMIGHENYNYQYSWLSGYKEGAVDYESNHELNGFLTFGTSPTASETTDYNTEGYIARVMYDYQDRYFGQASYRRDASSRFHPKHRWGNFWSVGAAWIISRESWFQASSWLNSLKLKASYGEVGNDKIGDYRYVDTYSINTVGGQPSLSLYQKGNPDITWETIGNLNVGLEFELFNSRLSGTVEFYNRYTRDMLLWVTSPSSLGYSGYFKNVGDMRNTGVELTLNGSPVRNDVVTWNIGLNFGYNKQKVTYLPDENKQLLVDGYGGYQSGNFFVGEGIPLGSFYIPKSAGLSEDGRQQWYYTDSNGNEVKTTNYSLADNHIFDVFQPIAGGFSTSVSAFGIDASIQFTYGLGGKAFDYEYALLMTVPISGATGLAFHKDVLNAWTPENTDTDVPRWNYGDQYTGIISDRFLIKSDYLSLQNIIVGYTLPSKWTRAAKLEKVRFYFNADNVYLWSRRKGFDPRMVSGYGAYSPMRVLSGGVNITF